MAATHYDNLIIGFGKGGKTLAAKLASEGEQVALVERSRAMYGGTCINIGCLPSKSLIIDAQSAHRAGEPGTGSFARAMAQKTALTDALRAANYNKVASLDSATVIDGTAQFTGPHSVRVTAENGDEQIIEADRIFINTGASPRIPDIPGLRTTPGVYDSTGMLSLPELPQRVVIIGAGFIGLEFASMLADFGSEVTVLQRSGRFLAQEDEDVAQAIRDVLEQQGVRLVLNAVTTEVAIGTDSAVTVRAEVDGEPADFAADAVLVAAGRTPNTADLNLQAAGVETDARGAIVVDEQLRTTAPNIWALGDVNGGPQHTYISLDDYRVVWSQLSERAKPYSRADRRNVPSCVFLHVPYARIGINEREAVERDLDVRVRVMPTAAVPKARVIRETEGLLKAVTDAETGEILGVMLLCPEAYEMINVVKVAMDMGAHAEELRDAIFTHPTMTEALNDLFA